MNQEQAGLIMLALMVLALGLAWWGWRRRLNRYRPLADALIWWEPSADAHWVTPALYVATTEADKPMERVAVGPLAYRSKVTVGVFDRGLSVSFPHGKSLLLPATGELRAGLATWTIDRVVEPDGLVMVRWRLGEKLVDSYFRVVDGDATAMITGIDALAKGTR